MHCIDSVEEAAPVDVVKVVAEVAERVKHLIRRPTDDESAADEH